MLTFRKSHPLIKIINSTIIDLPTPANLSVNSLFVMLKINRTNVIFQQTNI